MAEPGSPTNLRTLRPATPYQSSHLPITLSGQSEVQDLENLFIGISGLVCDVFTLPAAGVLEQG